MPPKERVDLRTYDERLDARKAFELAMRQAVMEFDAMDTVGLRMKADAELDFREFSQLVREREIGVHSEPALRARFASIDQDGSGMIDKSEYIVFALRGCICPLSCQPQRSLRRMGQRRKWDGRQRRIS